MSDLEIRRLDSEDVPEIHRVWSEAGLHVYPEGRDAFEHLAAEISAGTALFFGGFLDGAMAAVVLATHDGRKGWINRLAVLPEHRKKGHGQVLIHACEEAFRELGIGMSCALIEDWNDPSMALFQKEGYVFRKDIFYFRKTLGQEDW